MSYLTAAFLLGLAILVHELGHFVAARRVNMPIRIFSIGFGPKVWGRKVGATEYRLSLIPLGGYVLPDVKDEKEYFALPVGDRIVMACGGVLANAVLAFACLSLVNCFKLGLSWQAAVINPFVQVSSLTMKILAVVPQLFGRPDDMSGVVGIVAQGGSLIGRDPWNGLIFLAIMSINFLIMNLLPLPALDGCKILLFLLEKVHPVFLRLHYPLAIAGWVFIAVVTGYTLYIDVGRYII